MGGNANKDRGGGYGTFLWSRIGQNEEIHKQIKKGNEKANKCFGREDIWWLNYILHKEIEEAIKREKKKNLILLSTDI